MYATGACVNWLSNSSFRKSNSYDKYIHIYKKKKLSWPESIHADSKYMIRNKITFLPKIFKPLYGSDAWYVVIFSMFIICVVLDLVSMLANMCTEYIVGPIYFFIQGA